MRISNYIFYTFCLMAFWVVPTQVFAISTGFVQDMVTITDTSVTEGEITQLTVDFTNREEKKLTGKIRFYNRDELLGSRDFDLESMETETFTIDWEASFGQHGFIAKAENLKLEGATVSILGPATDSREIVIGFKNSSVAESLRERGGFSSIVAGVIDELYDFVRPLAQMLETWRVGNIIPLEDSQRRINFDKEQAEGKIKPILVLHGLFLTIAIFVMSHQIVLFSLVVSVFVLLLRRLFFFVRRLFRKKYGDES